MKISLKEVYLIKESVVQRQLVDKLTDVIGELEDALDFAGMVGNRELVDRLQKISNEILELQSKHTNEPDIRDREFAAREQEEKAAEQEANLDNLESILLQYGMPDDTSVEDALETLASDGVIDMNNATHVMKAEEAAQAVFPDNEDYYQ